MKNLYFLVLLFCSRSLISQTATFSVSDASNANAPVTNNQVFLHSVTGGNSSSHNFSITNITVATQSIIVRKYVQFVNTISVSDYAEMAFAYDVYSFPPNITSWTASVSAGGVLALQAFFMEASIAGLSEVHFKFMNAADTTNNPITLKLRYNIFAGLSSYKKDEFVVQVFPNPSTEKFQISYFDQGLSHVSYKLVNAEGQLVREEKFRSEKGKNIVSFSTENLSNGVYFIELFIDNNCSKHQLIINK